MRRRFRGQSSAARELSGRPETVRAVDEGAAGRGRSARLAISSRPSGALPVSSPHSARFRLATGFLLGIGLAALVIAVALAWRSSSSGHQPEWSSWAPNTGGKLGAAEIAEHVAPYYRLSSATQLDVVTLINLSNPNAQGTGGSGLTVAVNNSTSTSASTSSLSLLSGTTIAYNLCGTGSHDCAVPGTPSTARMLLLRREALELALYTFRYISGTENVVCVLPPGRTELPSALTSHLPTTKTTSPQRVTMAVVFQRQELQPWLNVPLNDTLSEFPPAVSELSLWQKTQEAGLVDQLTGQALYSEQIESEQTGGNLLVLNQLPPQ